MFESGELPEVALTRPFLTVPVVVHLAQPMNLMGALDEF